MKLQETSLFSKYLQNFNKQRKSDITNKRTTKQKNKRSEDKMINQ